MTDLKSSDTLISKHTKYEKRIKRISTDAVTRAIPDPRPTAGRPGWPPPALLHPPPTSELECSNNNRGTDGEIMVTRPRRAGHRGGTLSTITDKLIWALPGPGPPCSGRRGQGCQWSHRRCYGFVITLLLLPWSLGIWAMLNTAAN